MRSGPAWSAGWCDNSPERPDTETVQVGEETSVLFPHFHLHPAPGATFLPFQGHYSRAFNTGKAALHPVSPIPASMTLLHLQELMKKILRLSAPLLLLLSACAGLYAQNLEELKLPVIPGPNYAGKNFCFAVPANWDLPNSTRYSVRLYISSPVRTRVTVKAGGELIKSVFTEPDKILPVDLTPLQGQTLVRADLPPVPKDQIRIGTAVTIESEDPVVVYVMNLGNNVSEGMLVLPVNALGRQYRAGSYRAASSMVQELPSQYLITAPYDGTTVQICNPARTPNHPAGESFTIVMNAGDVYSAMTAGVGGDLSGTSIRSNKPIAVTAGVACAYVPGVVDFCCCDHLAEMMLPMESWGRHYKAVPIKTRLKGDFYRVFAQEANTTVFINGQEYGRLPAGACGDEGESWLEYRALGKNVVDISADKPVAVFQYNTAGAYDETISDPFYMALTPVEQYQKQAYISTPSADFPQNFLNIVGDIRGFASMEYSVAGSNQWLPVSNLFGATDVKDFTEEVGGTTYRGVSGEILPGVYRFRAAYPFGLNIYGFSNYESYGYPAAADLRHLSVTGTTPPDIDLDDAFCAPVRTGKVTSRVEDGPVTLPLSLVTLVPGATFNAGLKPIAYEPGVSTRASFELVVADPAQPAQGVIAASDMAGNLSYDTIRYTPGIPSSVSLSPESVDFGDVEVGTDEIQQFELKNNGSAPVNIDIPGLLSGAEGFSLADPLPPSVELLPGQSLVVRIRFSPAQSGALADTFSLAVDGCQFTARIALAGNGRQSQLAVPGADLLPEVGALTVEPNPVRGDRASVKFRMSGRGSVRVAIVDAAGKEIRVIDGGSVIESGTIQMPIDLSGVHSGAYFIRITADGRIYTAPLIVGR